jgi:response regulator RpfG family c-di-GMP phosphodiesterase
LGQYQTHPELGLELIKSNRLMTHMVKQIIIQHHEKFDGSGFPAQLKGKNILLLANVVSLVDDFVHLMIKKKLKPVEALKAILEEQNQVNYYNTVILENFIRIFADPVKLAQMAV